LTFVIYTFVFGFVFQARLPGADTSLDYVVWLLAGLAPWLAMQESIIAGANSIWANAGIVKNIPMKLEIVPLAADLTGLVPFSAGMFFVLVVAVFAGSGVSLATLAILPLGVLLLLFCAGVGLLLAPVSVMFRDFSIALPTLLTVVLFATPIFYPISALPPVLQWVSTWNPVYVLVHSIRVVVTEGVLPPVWPIAWVTVLSVVLFLVALRALRRVKGALHAFV
jgi:lipopolysaccharide transport system permease protein